MLWCAGEKVGFGSAWDQTLQLIGKFSAQPPFSDLPNTFPYPPQGQPGLLSPPLLLPECSPDGISVSGGYPCPKAAHCCLLSVHHRSGCLPSIDQYCHKYSLQPSTTCTTPPILFRSLMPSELYFVWQMTPQPDREPLGRTLVRPQKHYRTILPSITRMHTLHRAETRV